MIPVNFGPTGVGFDSIYIRNQNYIESTTNGLKYRIGQVECITGVQGIPGVTGPTSDQTGLPYPPDNVLTGATGIGIEAIYFNQGQCALTVLYTNGQLVTHATLQCPDMALTLNNITGPTGPTGPDLRKVLVGGTELPNVATTLSIYSDESTIRGVVVSHCDGSTGATGPTGDMTWLGSTGPTGRWGRDAWEGSTGSAGPTNSSQRAIHDIKYQSKNSALYISTTNNVVLKKINRIRGIRGPAGPFQYDTFAHSQLDVPVSFDIEAKEAVKQQFVLYKDISPLLFIESPLAYDMSYTALNDELFEACGNCIISKRRILARVRMTWDCNDTPLYRPFIVLNAGQSQVPNPKLFPTIVGRLYPFLTDSDDIFCMLNVNDTLSIHAGVYALHPMSDKTLYSFRFKNISMDIVQTYNL